MIGYHAPSAVHRRWLLINTVIGAAVTNALINGGLAWGSLKGERRVPLWSVPLVAKPSLLVTTLGTLFLLPFFTTLVTTSGVRLANRNGGLSNLEHLPFAPHLIRRVPNGLFRRSACFGALVLLILGPVAIVVFETAIPTMSAGHYIAYCIASSVLLGLLVTPPIALFAMADLPSPASALDAAAAD